MGSEMNELKYLEILTGERWTGVSLSSRPCAVRNYKYRLCGAIEHSFEQDLTLACDDIDCPGALRSLGRADNDDQLALHISEEACIDLDRVRRIIAESPRTETPIMSVELGRIAKPEICISFLRPESAMKLLRQWQQLCGRCLNNNLTGFMAVCSAVASAYRDRKIVFSMGCPESRRHGSISPDRMVAALPSAIVTDLMQEDKKCQRMNTSVMSADIASRNSRK